MSSISVTPAREPFAFYSLSATSLWLRIVALVPRSVIANASGLNEASHSREVASCNSLLATRTSWFAPKFATKVFTRNSQLATRHSQLTTRNSLLLATRHSQLTTRNSLLLTTHNSQLTTRNSLLLTTRNSLLTTLDFSSLLLFLFTRCFTLLFLVEYGSRTALEVVAVNSQNPNLDSVSVFR